MTTRSYDFDRVPARQSRKPTTRRAVSPDTDEEELHETRLPSSVRRYRPDGQNTTGRQMVAQGSPYSRIDPFGRPVIRQGNREYVMVSKKDAKRPHWLILVGVGMLAMLILGTTVSILISHLQATQQQQAYNAPPITEQFQVVGHNGDSASHPSFFMFINMRGTVEVIEVPAGDARKAVSYTGPHILGSNAYADSVTATFEDTNGDGKLDMLVQIGNQTLVYLNDGSKVRTVWKLGGCMLRYDLPPDQEWDDEPVETVYVVMTEQDPEKRTKWEVLAPRLAFLISIVLLVFATSPIQPVYIVKTFSVPAILLPIQTITVNVPVKATGLKTYPAVAASGMLTITNGGMLVQYLPAGFLLTSNSGVEIATDEGVTVPAGNGESYGVAMVSAHAVAAGRNGNIPAYSINRIYGTDIFVKNTRSFSGGRDAYSIIYATDSDKQTALMSAKSQATSKQPFGLLLKPCSEVTKVSDKQVNVTLTCQPIAYHVPTGARVLSIRVSGTSVILTCRVVAGA